ncbi:MAG: hypothetical protein ACFCU3_09345 [Verrucomicrobiales bacterium]
MNVAKKSPGGRQTITLPVGAVVLLDQLRGSTPKSQYLEELLRAEEATQEKRAFYAGAVAAYTNRVCEETLSLNAEYPVDEA